PAGCRSCWMMVAQLGCLADGAASPSAAGTRPARCAGEPPPRRVGHRSLPSRLAAASGCVRGGDRSGLREHGRVIVDGPPLRMASKRSISALFVSVLMIGLSLLMISRLLRLKL